MTAQAKSVAASFLAAIVIMVVALEFGGGSPQPAGPGIPDPGAVVGWGLPLVRLVTDAAAILTIGFLALAVFLLPSSSDDAEGLAALAVSRAGRAAIVWFVATVVLFYFNVADVFAVPLHEIYGSHYISGLAGVSTGRGIIGQAVLALVVAIGCRWTVGLRGLTLLLGLALATLAPISLTGHSASSGSHDLATVSILVHLVGVTLWVGGLAALAWVAHRGSKRLESAVARYSELAIWCFGIVVVSGVVNAATRIGSWSKLLGSDYGILVLAKVAAAVALGVFGYRQRRRIISQGKGFLRLAGSELLVMAMTVGLAVALSRSPTPVPDNLLSTESQELLGASMPPHPSVWHFVWGWSPSGVGLTVVLLGTALYLQGVAVMRRRGDAWPVGRTLSWLLGMLVVAWATFGGLGQYSHVMFSAHMVSHMMLSMVAPIFLVLAAPMTLALRTLPGPRQPGEVSPRQLLTSFLHSRFSRFITHPLVGPIIFVGSLYGLYFTPIFDHLMSNHLGHAVMEVHFLLVGTLYYYVIIGVDPAPRRIPPFARFGVLLVTIPFHAFFSIAVMSSNTIFAKSYWVAIDRPYLTDLAHDQYLGGGIAWAMGEIPLVIVMGALFVQWFASDRRDAVRFDRSEKRTDDGDLEAYNRYLKDLAAHGKRREP